MPFYQAVKKIFRSIFPFHLVQPRRTHIYCIGTAKSGTHSIGALFSNQLRSAHEPESDKIIDLIFDISNGCIDDNKLSRYLLQRDRNLWLEVDSSQLNFFVLSKLVELFPNAKFILTIRNPYSWLDSFINHQLARGCSDKWLEFRNFRFSSDIYTHQQEEMAFKEKGLYTLDGYLSYWSYHNRIAIDTVPEDRLLIVRTDKISECIEEIAAFVGISGNNLREQELHVFKAKRKFHLLDTIDQVYLEYKIKEHCADLISEFFPEIQSKEDAFLQ